jgi:hypothetical protein
LSENGNAVQGVSDNGCGVLGAAGQAAVAVQATNVSSGVALRVAGPAVFSRSGIATVPGNQASVTVTGVSLASGSVSPRCASGRPPGYVGASRRPERRRQFLDDISEQGPKADTRVGWFLVN